MIFFLPVRRFGLCSLRCWPFLDFLVVYLRCPCAGRHLLSLHAAKKVSKESGLPPQILKRIPWLGGGSGSSGIRALAHSALVTKQSFFRRRCARRRGSSLNTRSVSPLLKFSPCVVQLSSGGLGNFRNVGFARVLACLGDHSRSDTF